MKRRLRGLLAGNVVYKWVSNSKEIKCGVLTD